MELFRALGALAEPPTPETARLAELLELGAPPAAEVYDALFLFELAPYASIWLGREGMVGGEARDRIAGFWRALGLEPPAEPDHLALMLGLQARLAELEAGAAGERDAERWRRARGAWIWEHLLSWLPVYLETLRPVADPFYGRWATTLAGALETEARRLEPPELPPLHLRRAPPLADPRREGGAAFLASLLSPVRSGVPIVGADLRRGAAALGLAARVGERRFVLRALLGQDAAATLAWLGRHALSWEGRLASLPEVFAPAVRFWRRRCRTTAELLREVGAEVGPPE